MDKERFNTPLEEYNFFDGKGNEVNIIEQLNDINKVLTVEVNDIVKLKNVNYNVIVTAKDVNIPGVGKVEYLGKKNNDTSSDLIIFNGKDIESKNKNISK